jgi:hypothetical protein
MMKLLQSILDSYRWTWVGTVEGETRLTDDNGRELKAGACKNAYWNLYERGDGKRSYREIGNVFRTYASQSCRVTKAQIVAWKYGGPLPPLHSSPAPAMPKGELIVFPGGKDDR